MNTCTMKNAQNADLLQVKQAGLNEFPFQFVFTKPISKYEDISEEILLCW